MGATLAPLWVCPGGPGALVPIWLGESLLLFGAFCLVFAKITLGRSFGMIPAHRGLTQAGPYRLVRHPMYAGYLLCHVGFLLLNPTFWNLGVYACFYALQVPRLVVEEIHLRQDPNYGDYAAKVPYRLIPGIF
jgi:protein-S-isoprenylcysteine O-methyltransferase Ste14